MTVVCSGDELILEQITKQVEKLEDVLTVKVLKDGQSVNRELILVKVRVEPEQRPGISSIVDIFRANIIDVGKESMIIELTGTKSKLERLLTCWKAMRFWSWQERVSPDFPEVLMMSSTWRKTKSNFTYVS